jgi:hypothetical protein
MGRWIGERLNEMEGQVRFFLPEGGVSALDAPGQPFHDDPGAQGAFFDALEATVRQTVEPQADPVPEHINDPEFAAAVVAAFRALHGGGRPARKTRGTTMIHRKPFSKSFRAMIAPANPSSAAARAPACRPNARKPAGST